MIHFRKLAAFGVLGALVAYGSAAQAQGTAQERSACEGDAFRFCSSDIPFVSKIEACLVANEAQISPACRAEFTPAKTTKLRPEHFNK